MRHVFAQALVLLISLLCFSQPIPAIAAQSVPDAKPIPIVLSTDVGNEIDDQWAIAYLFTNPAFNVLGAISAQAPSLPDPSAHATYLILRDEVEHRLGLTVHPPLLEGSSTALQNEHTPQPSQGSAFLIDISHRFGPNHRLTVVMIGAATDVASAMLQDPALAQRIRIVAMAFGSRSPDGGREYNVENDPKAWQVLLQSKVPLTVGPGTTCRKYLALDYDQAQKLLAGHGPVAAWLWAEYRSWYYRYVMPLRSNDFSRSWFIWDIVTLADLRGFATETVGPRPRLRDDLSLQFPTSGSQEGKTITWITGVDSERLWADFISCLDKFQRTHAIYGDDDQGSVQTQVLLGATP